MSASEGVRLRRNSLSVDRIAAAALVVLDREGAEAVSLRKVAEELGAAPVSLYNHIRDKADLVAAMVAIALRNLEWPTLPAEPWERLAEAWRRYRLAQLAHPQLARLVMMTANVPVPLETQRLVEVTLAAGRELGLTPAEGFELASALSQMTLASVLAKQLEEQGDGLDELSERRVRDEWLALPPEEFPELRSAARRRLPRLRQDAIFERSLTGLLPPRR